MTYIKTITDENGVQVYPQTHENAVIDNNGNPIGNKLNAFTSLAEESAGKAYVPTLNSTPTSSTLTYTRSGTSINFVIGQFARVADITATTGYKFYQLQNITVDNEGEDNETVIAHWQYTGQRSLGTGANDACAGNDSRLSDARNAADVSAWAKAANKPSYAYSEIGYVATPISASTSTLALTGNDPIYVVTVSANLSSVTLTNNPSAGHSCHVLFVSDANDDTEYTVAIAHDSTNRICPSGEDLSFTVPANGSGYVEIDFLNVNNKVYVRGV